MSKSLPEPAYHIFVDEYGDHGLKKTASEFFIVSAVVVATETVPDLQEWIARIKKPMKNQQRRDFHFIGVDERMKYRASRYLGKMPVRCFGLISHKPNMIGHRNVKCEVAYDGRIYGDDGTSYTTPILHRKTKFPNFVLKVLLERATKWCHRRSLREFKEPRPVAITIAKRGGFYLSDFKSYLEIDQRRWRKKTGTLPGYLAWPVVDLDLIGTAPAANVAGLQLADIVSGSFSRAIDEKTFGECDRRYVQNLAPRIARIGRHRTIAGFGVTGLPWDLWLSNFSPEQEELFRLFGYNNEKLVRPGPILPGGF
jgi:Protein of unknown function (DUF3800)